MLNNFRITTPQRQERLLFAAVFPDSFGNLNTSSQNSLAVAASPLDDPQPEPQLERLTPEVICRDYATRIFRVAFRMLNNEIDAEDITQEVLLQVVRKLDTFRGDSSITTWLHRITTNAVLALRRKRATIRERQLDASEGGPSVEQSEDGRRQPCERPEHRIEGKELSDLIDASVRGLPGLYREVFVLADIEGLANAEIGAILGLSLPAVKSRLHRARLLLRAELAPYLEDQCA